MCCHRNHTDLQASQPVLVFMLMNSRDNSICSIFVYGCVLIQVLQPTKAEFEDWWRHSGASKAPPQCCRRIQPSFQVLQRMDLMDPSQAHISQDSLCAKDDWHGELQEDSCFSQLWRISGNNGVILFLKRLLLWKNVQFGLFVSHVQREKHLLTL